MGLQEADGGDSNYFQVLHFVHTTNALLIMAVQWEGDLRRMLYIGALVLQRPSLSVQKLLTHALQKRTWDQTTL